MWKLMTKPNCMRDRNTGSRVARAAVIWPPILGATHHTGIVANVGFEPDVIVECTGVGQVITDSIRVIGAGALYA